MKQTHATDAEVEMERDLLEMPAEKRNNVMYILQMFSRIPEAKASKGLELFRNALEDETFLYSPAVRERFRAVFRA